MFRYVDYGSIGTKGTQGDWIITPRGYLGFGADLRLESSRCSDFIAPAVTQEVKPTLQPG